MTAIDTQLFQDAAQLQAAMGPAMHAFIARAAAPRRPSAPQGFGPVQTRPAVLHLAGAGVFEDRIEAYAGRAERPCERVDELAGRTTWELLVKEGSRAIRSRNPESTVLMPHSNRRAEVMRRRHGVSLK